MCRYRNRQFKNELKKKNNNDNNNNIDNSNNHHNNNLELTIYKPVLMCVKLWGLYDDTL